MGLTVSDLGCTRGGRLVLRDLSFAVGDGETLVLRGPNGVGKSTLLRVLAGLLPAAGRIELDGRALADDADHAERIGYLGHLDAIKPQLTVAENLAFWAALTGGDAAAGREGFDLGPIADQPAHLCSAGQKRRLALARLLVAPRRLWLLDEPTIALDAAAETRLVAAIRAHCAAGGCAVVATHTPLALPSRELTLGAAGRSAADPFLAGVWA